MTRFLLLCLTVLLLLSSCNRRSSLNEIRTDFILPSRFDNGDRIFLRIPTANDDTIEVYTDTGGGFTAIFPSSIARLELEDKIAERKFDGRSNTLIACSDIIPNEVYHPFITKRMSLLIKDPFYFVPDESLAYSIGDSLTEGFFGQFFFLDRAWTFDYLEQKIILHSALNIDVSAPNAQKIGLKKGSLGHVVNGHPSFNIQVDGEVIPMLFDTGATFGLSEKAASEFQGEDKVGGSFIAKSIFEKWKSKHPDWKIIEGGDIISSQGKDFAFDMIEVPEVILGGISVGPVWFSMRNDEAWSEWMIKSMDRVVKGALGGSALKYVRVSIDYRKQALEFYE